MSNRRTTNERLPSFNATPQIQPDLTPITNPNRGSNFADESAILNQKPTQGLGPREFGEKLVKGRTITHYNITQNLDETDPFFYSYESQKRRADFHGMEMQTLRHTSDQLDHIYKQYEQLLEADRDYHSKVERNKDIQHERML